MSATALMIAGAGVVFACAVAYTLAARSIRNNEGLDFVRAALEKLKKESGRGVAWRLLLRYWFVHQLLPVYIAIAARLIGVGAVVLILVGYSRAYGAASTAFVVTVLALALLLPLLGFRRRDDRAGSLLRYWLLGWV